MTDATPPPVPVSPLTGSSLAEAVDALAELDPDLGAVVARFGRPPLWDREPGFPTLVHLILEQQVSLASAKAAFDRLRVAADPLTPGSFLRLADGELLAIGFSRQKTRYARALARAVDAGELFVAEVDGEPAAFSIFEAQAPELAVIHFERAVRSRQSRPKK